MGDLIVNVDKMTLRIYRYMLISFIITFVYSNHTICLSCLNFQTQKEPLIHTLYGFLYSGQYECDHKAYR